MANENKNALKNALDRLAAAIKDNKGWEAAYPFTIREMCNVLCGGAPTDGHEVKGKKGFFYFMTKMAHYIAAKYGAELPLTIEEMIEALNRN